MYNNIAALWKKTKTFVAVATIWLSNGGYPYTVLKSNQNDGAKNRLMMCHHEWCSVAQIMQQTGVFSA